MVSLLEELDDFIGLDGKVSRNGKYVVLIDPLDGSSNIDVNVSIGTIFSIYRRISFTGSATLEDFLQKGHEQVASGYVIYGSSTMLVYTTGHGVNGFTLDPSIGEFCLSHANITIPESGNIYSINEGNYVHFPDGVKKYINIARKLILLPTGLILPGISVLWWQTFIATCSKGGIYIYPETAKSPKGKLRLLYECNPLAFIAEQAGGKASNGFKRIMEVDPKELHQRCPLYIGSRLMVEDVEKFLEASRESAGLAQS